MENNFADEELTSGSHLSFWTNSTNTLQFVPLQAHLETDVVVVGGGIAGLTVAYCLLKSGKKVALVEDGAIASGETGRTTAHLTHALDDRYYHLQKLFGEKNLPLIAQSHTQAIRFIERVVEEEKIDCSFARLNGYLFLHPSDQAKSLEKELKAATRAGLHVTMKKSVPGLLHEKGPCLEFEGQAQLHPISYLNGLCKAIVQMGGEIFTYTHAQEIDSKGVRTRNGFFIHAGHVVVATNTPVNNKYTMHLKQFPQRTYVIGARVKKGVLPRALWWDTGDFRTNASIPPYHYVRLNELDDKHELLICGGEDHPTGLPGAEKLPEAARYDLLEHWAREHFPMEDVVYRWSGQVMEPMDSLGYIGRNPGDSNIYIVTGDSGNGLTHGTIAGMLITDLVHRKENPWEKIYDPARVKWFSAGGIFLKEFVSGLMAYLKNKPDADVVQQLSLRRDEAKVVNWDGKKCGIYRDGADVLHVVDATCTHLHCTVKWNSDEKSWDCPCHGSRFSHEGHVMNGPANSPLPYYRELYDTSGDLPE